MSKDKRKGMIKHFIVKPEDKVVVAITKNRKSFFQEIQQKSFLRTIYYDSDLHEPENEDVFKGVARCDEHDTFDEKTGKDIAALKADKKYYKAMAKCCQTHIKHCTKAIDYLSELFNKYSKEIDKIDVKLKKYTEGAEA